MSKPLSYLPVWKANATPAERLRELALIAEKHPEMFKRFVVAYLEDLPNNCFKTRYHCFNLRTPEAIGVMEMAKIELHKYTHGG